MTSTLWNMSMRSATIIDDNDIYWNMTGDLVSTVLD